jgi:hypothetical protein
MHTSELRGFVLKNLELWGDYAMTEPSVESLV